MPQGSQKRKKQERERKKAKLPKISIILSNGYKTSLDKIGEIVYKSDNNCIESKHIIYVQIHEFIMILNKIKNL